MSWGEVTLGSLYKVASSKRVLKSDWKTEGIPFYRGREITALSRFDFVENELYISEEMYSDFSKKHGVPQAEDIMITAIGTIGNSYIVKDSDKFYFKDASVLWLKKEKEVDSKFINYWLKSKQFFSQLDVGLGATVDTLTINKVQSLKISIPSIATQHKIVAKLDLIFEQIDKAVLASQANAENAEAFFQSFLAEVFNSENSELKAVSIGEISEIISGSGFPVDEQGLLDEEVPFYKVSDMNLVGNERLMISHNNSISKETAKRLGAKIIPVNSVIFPKIGGAIATNKKRILSVPSCVDNNVMAISPNQKVVTPEFFYYLISSIKLSSFANEAALPSIKKSTVEERIVKIPTSLKEQERLCKKIESLKNNSLILRTNYLRKLSDLAHLKKSILSQAFNGELVKD